jgi:membrane protease YdiL (CAAX protease family)
VAPYPAPVADRLALSALATALLFALLALTGGAWRARSTDRTVGSALGLGRGRLGARATLAACLGLVGLSHALQAALELGNWSSPGLAQLQTALAGLGPRELLLPLAALVLGSAVGEELFFRGFLQRALGERLPAPVAIGASAVAFGLAHGDWSYAAAAAGLGLYLGALAWRDDSIRAAALAHAANNAIALLEAAGGIDLPPLPLLPLGLALAALGWGAARPPSL